MNKNNVSTRLLKEALTDIYLEALDFKNVRSYPISDDGIFKTSSGAIGKVNTEYIDYDDITQLQLPQIVSQSYDFYRRKKPEHSSMYNFGYGIDGLDTQAKKTNYKELLEILLTVMEYLRKFIEKNKPFAVTIVATDKKGGPSADLQKKLIYDRMISNNIPKGYAEDKITFYGIEGKIIYRKTLPNK